MEKNAVQNAVQSLTQDLITHGAAYDRPIAQLYSTTLGLIFLIHVIFLFQWTHGKTRRNVVVIYEQIVRRKQFHKLVMAILSHPAPDGSFDSITISGSSRSNRDRNSYSNFNANDNYSTAHGTRRSALEIDMGDVHGPERGHEYGVRVPLTQQWQGIGRRGITRANYYLLQPLMNGHLAGLPLLTYIAHILWQCRPLEELYDYTYDNDNANAIHHFNENFNVSTIIDRDTIIQNSFRQIPVQKHTNGRSGYNFEYYRVLIVLSLSAYLMDLLATYLSLRYLRQDRELLSPTLMSPPSPSTTSSSSSSSNALRNTLIATQTQRGICTLTPMCTALLVLYNTHFPHTPISVLPFINTSYIFGSSSKWAFIISFIILTFLSYRSYPFLGMFYGSISGMLWTLGLTKFLADKYWGGCLIFTLCMMCAISMKAELLEDDNERNNRSDMSTSRSTNTITITRSGIGRLRDWFPWLDYVPWDAHGNIIS
jgi:hypothetical protein